MQHDLPARTGRVSRALVPFAIALITALGNAPGAIAADTTRAPAHATRADATNEISQLGDSSYVAVVVRIATPPGVSRERIVAGMKSSVPEYQAVPGLVRKYFTISDDNRFGGIYLFTNRAAAEGHFNPAWSANVVKTFGVQPEVSYFTSPIQIDGKNAADK